MQTLILTTTGRHSGQPRPHALIYGRDGDDYLVVASRGGAPQHPAWYLNLEANPKVEVQVKGDKMRAHARTATPEEKQKLWPIMTRVAGVRQLPGEDGARYSRGHPRAIGNLSDATASVQSRLNRSICPLATHSSRTLWTGCGNHGA